MTGLNVVLYDYPTSICSQMARLALLEKGVPFERRNIDIMKKAEQFEPWYTALNPSRARSCAQPTRWNNVRVAPKATIQGMSPKWRDGPTADAAQRIDSSKARDQNLR